jgi:ankyrin repeat protein
VVRNGLKFKFRVAGVAIIAARLDGITPLYIAAERGHAAVVSELLAAPSVAADLVDEDGWSPLHVAAWKGHAAVVTALLSCPAVNINRQTPDGTTPLRIARDRGHVAVAAAIQARGGFLTAGAL